LCSVINYLANLPAAQVVYMHLCMCICICVCVYAYMYVWHIRNCVVR
jgi:hypothetical protein